jgi:fructose-1,6-bisphosphatase/inositol monophosphatase family enzyme
MNALSAELDVAVDAARRAGRIQMELYERLERIVHKSERDVVTEADGLSEELIIAAIRNAFPEDAVLAEESGRSTGVVVKDDDSREPGTSAAGAAEHRLWVIDPLDGTINYANGIPVFCVSIGLVIDGRPSVGVIHDPARDEMFTAIVGQGARLDGNPVRHPAKPKLSDAVVSLALPASRFALRERRIRKAIRVSRNLGSASLSLAYVSNGRFDATIQSGGLNLWDVAAAGLIAQEAGARVSAPDGRPWFDLAYGPKSVGVLAAAPAHHATLMEMLR